MINLIPPQGRALMKREYMFRVGATFCILFGWLALFFAVAHIPTYVLVKAQIQNIDAVAQRESSRDEEIKQSEAEVRAAQAVIMQLRAVKESRKVADIVGEVHRLANDSIRLHTFVLTDLEEKTSVIQVQGSATTREEFVAFKDALEASLFFARAEIPISDLARDTDLPFMMTLTLADIQ